MDHGHFAESDRNMQADLLEILSDDLDFIKDSILQKNFYSHGFIRRFSEKSSISLETVESKFMRMCDHARDLMHNGPRISGDNRISHRMWLTNSDNPHEANVDFLSSSIYAWKNCFDSDWRHKFWLIDKDKVPNTAKFLKEHYPDVEFLSPYDDLSDGPWRKVFGAFMRDGKFTAASDVLRLQVIHEYGGLYTDLGVSFKTPIGDVFSKFDYVMIYWDGLFFQSSLFYANKENAITSKFQKYYDGRQAYPIEYMPDLSAASEILLFCGPNVTAQLMAMPEQQAILPLAANQKFLSWMAQQSWYTRTEGGQGKYGNAYIPEAKLSILPQP